MVNCCALKTENKNTSPNHPNVKACTKSSWCEDFAHALTFGLNGSFGVVMSAQIACIILPR